MKIHNILFKTKGRAGRFEYLIHTIISFIVFSMPIYLPLNILENINHIVFYLIIGVYVFALMVWFVSEICITIRRFHDLNRSGTACFLLLIPLYNIYISLMLFIERGTIGSNDYGDDPVSEINVLPHLHKDKSVRIVVFTLLILFPLIYIFIKNNNSEMTVSNNVKLNNEFITEETLNTIFNKLDENSNTRIGSHIKLNKGYFGYIISFNKNITTTNFNNELLRLGFTEFKKPLSKDDFNIIKTIKFKTFYEEENIIYIQMGFNIKAITTFIIYLKDNLFKEGVQ